METEILIWLQAKANPILDAVMEAITMLGETQIIIALLMIVYLGYDKRLGKRGIILFGGSLLLNLTLKDVFKLPRPIGVKGINSLRTHTATGFSFPSGHTQSFATMYFILNPIIKKRWFTIIGFLLAILVGISRLYLGVHWPKDVFFGLLFAWLSVKVVTYLMDQYGENKALAAVALFLHGSMIIYGSEDLVKMAAVMLGATIGLMLEERFIQFSQARQLKQRIIHSFVGVIMILAVYAGLRIVMPNTIVADYIRYLMVGFSACGVVPAVIKQFFS